MKVYAEIRYIMDLYKEEMLRNNCWCTVDLINILEPCYIRHGYRTRMTETPKNILIINDAGVGDFINLSPCLRAIRDRYPQANIVLVLYPRALGLAEACPYVDEVIANERKCSWQDLFSLYEWNQFFTEKLLPYRFDIAFVFPHYGSAVMLAYLSGAKVRVAYDISWVQQSSAFAGIIPYEAVIPFLNHPVNYSHKNVHATERYLGVLDAFWGEKVTNRNLEVWCKSEDLVSAEFFLSEWLTEDFPIYAIVMGGEATSKRWPPDKYAQFVRLLQQNYPEMRYVLMGGGVADEQEAQIFLKTYYELHGNEVYIKNLVNKLTYSESVAIMDKCQAYIGNDTGNMHLAAALNKPILAPICYAAEFSIRPDDVPNVFAPLQVPAVFIQPTKALDDCKSKKTVHGCCHFEKVHCIGQIEVQTMRLGFEILRKQCNSGKKGVIYVN